MTARTEPPFRADHVGSLIRPAALVEARRAVAQGRIAPGELRRIQEEAIRGVVRLQEEIGHHQGARPGAEGRPQAPHR